MKYSTILKHPYTFRYRNRKQIYLLFIHNKLNRGLRESLSIRNSLLKEFYPLMFTNQEYD